MKGRPLPEKLRARVKRLVQTDGAPSVAKRLGISPNTIARIIAGMPVQNGTRALVERGLS